MAADCASLDDDIRRILAGQQTAASSTPAADQLPNVIGRLGNASTANPFTGWLPIFTKDTNLEAAISEGKTIPVAAAKCVLNILVELASRFSSISL